jgi:ATP-dependent Zn protease
VRVAVIATIKTIMAFCFVLLLIMLIWGVASKGASLNKDQEIGYSDLFKELRSGQLLDATIEGCDLYGHLKSSPIARFHTTIPNEYADLRNAMLEAGVTFSIQAPKTSLLVPLLFNVFPYFILFLLTIPPFWVIFKKAGFPPIYSFLILIPMANLAVLYVLAFSKWKASPAPKL